MQKDTRQNMPLAMQTKYSSQTNHGQSRILWSHRHHWMKTMAANRAARPKTTTMIVQIHTIYLQNQRVPHHKMVTITTIIIMPDTIMCRYLVRGQGARRQAMVALWPTRKFVAVLITRYRPAWDQHRRIIATRVVGISYFQ